VSAANASVGANAFKGAAQLSRAELPDKLKTDSYSPDNGIFGSAFTDTNLQVLIVRSPNAGLFSTLPSTLVNVYVPDANLAAYKAKTYWSNIKTKIFGISTLPPADDPSQWL
jgi:hypothetical protein